MKIAILGGSFDPVHLGHRAIADQSFSHFNLDRLYFVPAAQNPLKVNAPQANAEHRLAMLQLAVQDRPEFYISDFEINKTGPSYSIDTVKHFSQKYSLGKQGLYFLLGADNVVGLHKWKNFPELFELSTLVVFGRRQSTAALPGLNEQQIADLDFNFLSFDFPASSTSIRQSLADSNLDQVRRLLTAEVLDYILKFKVY